MTITVKKLSTIAPTGGTDVVFTKISSQNETTLYQVLTDTDKRLRRSLKIKVTRPKPSSDAPNGYTQQRVVATFYQPKLLANGKITVNTKQCSIGYDTEATSAEVQELLDFSALLGTQSALKVIFQDGLSDI